MHRFFSAICVVSAIVLVGGRASAADEPAGAHGHAGIMIATMHDEKGKEIEKQFDLSDAKQAAELQEQVRLGNVVEMKKKEPPDLFGLKRWDLGVWSIVIFLVLFFALTKFAWKPMVEGLNKREENIRGALEQAERTRKDAMELQSQLDAKMKVAGSEIAKMMDEGRRDAQALKEQMVAEAKAEIQHERDRLHREIETAKDQALQDIWQQSVALATKLSSKAIRRNLTSEDHQRLLDETIAELKTTGAGIGKRYA
jgi:F-type H+-transporting ATPase subunit b